MMILAHTSWAPTQGCSVPPVPTLPFAQKSGETPCMDKPTHKGAVTCLRSPSRLATGLIQDPELLPAYAMRSQVPEVPPCNDSFWPSLVWGHFL